MHHPLPQNDELVVLHWFLHVFEVIPPIRLAHRRRGTLQAFLQEVALQETHHTKKLGLLTSRVAILSECNIAHALEKTKYSDSDIY